MSDVSHASSKRVSFALERKNERASGPLILLDNPIIRKV